MPIILGRRRLLGCMFTTFLIGMETTPIRDRISKA